MKNKLEIGKRWGVQNCGFSIYQSENDQLLNEEKKLKKINHKLKISNKKCKVMLRSENCSSFLSRKTCVIINFIRGLSRKLWRNKFCISTIKFIQSYK